MWCSSRDTSTNQEGAAVAILLVEQFREVRFDGIVAVFVPVAAIRDGGFREAYLGNEDGKDAVSPVVFPIVHPRTIRTRLLHGQLRTVISTYPQKFLNLFYNY